MVVLSSGYQKTTIFKLFICIFFYFSNNNFNFRTLLKAWSTPSTFPTPNDQCIVTNDAAERDFTLLQAGQTLYVTLKSDSCKFDNYPWLYLYEERTYMTLCWFYNYEVIDDFTIIASCSIPAGPNTNGNYTLYSYWSADKGMYWGYQYLEDKFMVVDGVEPDVYVPQVQNAMLTPTSTSINVLHVNKISSFLKIIEEGSGVSYVWSYAHDSKGQWLCSSNPSITAGNEFDGVWRFDCDIYPNMNYVNGNATIFYQGYDKANNYFHHTVNNSFEIVGGQDPDFKPPIIESFTLSSQIVSINEPLVMDLAVSDVGSGINYAYCNAYMNSTWYGYSFWPTSDFYDMKYRQYTFSYNILNLGDYMLQCYVYDNQWNWAMSEVLYFSVVNAPTISPTHPPTLAPSLTPTETPTLAPTLAPTPTPSLATSLAPTTTTTIQESFQYSWNVSVWDYYGTVSALKWEYQAFSPRGSTLGTKSLVQVEVIQNVSGSTEKSENINFRSFFFTGWSPNYYIWSRNFALSPVNHQFSSTYHRTYKTAQELDPWVNYLTNCPACGSDGNVYFESKTLTGWNNVSATIQILYTYAEVTQQPTRQTTPSPSRQPTPTPTVQPSPANAPTSNTTTVTITITIEVSGKPARASGRRMQAVSNSTDTPSCKQSISYVLAEALKHYESEAISALNLIESIKLPSATNDTLHQLLKFKMDVTAEDITPEQLYAKFKNGTSQLNKMQLDQISQFIGAYSAAHNCAAFSTIELGKPEVMSSYTSYVEPGSTSEPIFCPTNSDDAKLSTDAVIGIAFAVAFSSFCLFSLFLYWYVKVYQKNFTAKKIIEHHTADLNVISTQVNPI